MVALGSQQCRVWVVVPSEMTASSQTGSVELVPEMALWKMVLESEVRSTASLLTVTAGEMGAQPANPILWSNPADITTKADSNYDESVETPP